MDNESSSFSGILLIVVIVLGIWCYNLKKQNDALTVDLNNYEDALSQANGNIDDANSNIDDVNSAIQDVQDAQYGDYGDMSYAISSLHKADSIDEVDAPILTSKAGSQ